MKDAICDQINYIILLLVLLCHNKRNNELFMNHIFTVKNEKNWGKGRKRVSSVRRNNVQ